MTTELFLGSLVVLLLGAVIMFMLSGNGRANVSQNRKQTGIAAKGGRNGEHADRA